MRIRTLALCFTLIAPFQTPTLAQPPRSPGVDESNSCGPELLERSPSFERWLTAWNEEIGPLELSDFEVHAGSRPALDCSNGVECTPLDVYRRANPRWPLLETMALVVDSPDHARSISLQLCGDRDCSYIVEYFDSVRDEAGEIILPVVPDIGGWLSPTCFFVAGRRELFDADRNEAYERPAVRLYGREPEVDYEALFEAPVPSPSQDEIQSLRTRLQPWLQTRFPKFRCWHEEYQKLESYFWNAMDRPLSPAELETFFGLVLKDGEIDPAERDLLDAISRNLERLEDASRALERIGEFLREHSDAGREP